MAATSWYRVGSVALTNGSKTVTGTGTAFTSNVIAGDLFFAPDGKIYEIDIVTSDTVLQLYSVYGGTTASAQAYGIVRNFTANSQSQVAANMLALQQKYNSTLDQFDSFMTSPNSTFTYSGVAKATLAALASACANALDRITTAAQTIAGQVTFNQNVGIASTIPAWAGDKALQLPWGAISSGYEYSLNVATVAYRDNASWRYQVTGQPATLYRAINGAHSWFTAPSGTAGNAISFTQSMTLNASSQLLLNTTSAPAYSSVMRMNGGLEIHNSQQLNVVPANANPFEFVNRAGGGFDFYTTGATLGARLDSSGALLLGTASNGANARLVSYGNFALFQDGTYTGYLGKASTLVSGGAASDLALRSDTNLVLCAGGFNEGARLDTNRNLLVGISSGSQHTIRKSVTSNAGNATLFVNGDVETSLAVYGVSGGSVGNAANAAVKVNRDATTLRSINAHGTINASGADYAEYEQADAQSVGLLKKGDLVGRTAEGKLTHLFDSAVTFGIKSTDPCLVGGDVWADENVIGKRPDAPQLNLPAYEGPADPGEKPEAPADATETEQGESDFDVRLAKWEADSAAYRAAKSQHESECEQSRAAHQIELDSYEKALAAFLEKLEAARQTVDRIAYAGRVPVNVPSDATWAVGDYLVPVKRKGRIVAEFVSPDKVSFDQYRRAVGQVFGIYQDGRPFVAVKTI
ncbi:hypothetical protein [Parvibium lacunae]|uniref:Peptidase S74 domain-containing protein n=1 Tax=Parvibium lacunae TaxID=1888893 RepID=A0A368L876_9BURK|nr:hypothetical protein [Parvibium lacunae]RCS59711.1 hypothetical protein DU000_03110 [Parvibium lacunae]